MNGEDRDALVEKILGKSEGPFWWTVLVLNELSSSYGDEEINQILEDMPRDMESLYQTTLEDNTRINDARDLWAENC